MTIRSVLLATPLAILAVAPVHAQKPAKLAPPPGLDAYVNRALEQLGAPGAAVLIVKDDQVILTKGYGYRDVEKRLPVDEHTRFQIASNTKAFTAAGLGILVSQGKLKWDDKVIERLPSFRMSDPYVTSQLTVRDLLAHRSGLGLGAGDLLWLHSDRTRDEVVHQIRYIPLATSFRSHYAYDNVLFVVAGQLLGAVAGERWDDFIPEQIFQPLGMTESRTSITDFKPGDNVALPYHRSGGRMERVSYDSVDNTAPAGGIVSSVSDLSHWIRAQLDSGRVGGSRLWDARATREMWAPTTMIQVGRSAPELRHLQPNFRAYGLGWFLDDYRGHKIVHHSGGLAGMISQTFMVPDIKLGVVVLTNGESSAATAIADRIVDHYLGAPDFDYITAIKTVNARADSQASASVSKAKASRAADVGPSLPAERYASTYRDQWMGNATITEQNGKLVFQFSSATAYTGDLEHWQYDTFVAHWRNSELPDAFVTFALKPDGTVDHFTMLPVDPETDFSYDYQDLYFVPVE